MKVFPPLSLRGRFLLLVLLGVLMPLGVVGVWLSRSALQSGERLVRDRLSVSLFEIVNAIGVRWTEHRSVLLDLAESPAVLAALTDGRGPGDAWGGVAGEELASTWSRAALIAAEAELLDPGGRVVGRLAAAADRGGGMQVTSDLGTLPHTLPIRHRATGERLGTLEVQLRVGALLPRVPVVSGVGGSVLAIFDGGGDVPLGPMALDPELFSLPRFTWAGEDWISVDRRLTEPPLRVALAGPIGPVIAPFTDAARRGTMALVVVMLVAFVLATLFTRRFTRSLLRLAEAADAVSKGDLSRRAEEAGAPEVMRLARAFNSMTESLQETLQRLTQREAVAAVGEFAASLAHEVRNPLTAVRLDLQLTRHKVVDQPDATELVDHAIMEIDRLNESVSGFLQVARSGRSTPTCLDLRTPVEAAVRAARPRFDALSAQLEYSPPATPVRVIADGGAVEQLTLNLLLNAADSLGDRRRAGIDLHVSGDRVDVSVWDEGCGVADGDTARVFEPFYSTKEHGTGLGLAVAQRIAHAHGTELRVSSEVGTGTTFRFELPLAERPVEDPTDTKSTEGP